MAQASVKQDIGKRPLKIVCSIWDPMRGGPVVRARAVYQVMQSEGHQPRIAFPDMEGTAADYVEQGGVPYDKVRMEKPVMPRRFGAFLNYLARVPSSILEMRKYLKRVQPDVLHVNGAYDFVPALAGRLAGIPIVWHLNDTVLGEGISKKLGRLVDTLATEVVVAAGRVGRHYGIPEDRATLLPAPVDVDRFAAREVERVPVGQVTFGLVGNWNWVKAQDRFVDLIAGLRGLGHDAKGIVCGGFIPRQEDFWRPILDDIDTRGLKPFIAAEGFCEDVPALMRSLDILALTSRSEASPMCVLEAMSIGVPVIAFDVGGVADMLGQGEEAAGIVVSEGDTDALIAAADSLLKDEARYRRMAQNGQKRARDHFSLAACVQRHEDVYFKAVGSKA